jgi:DNA-binding NtrC family response regulator
MLIMIVDGDANRCAGLCALLSRRGHKVQTARDRTEAISILWRSSHYPELVLLDPDCGGESATWFLDRLVPLAPQAKVILMPWRTSAVVP